MGRVAIITDSAADLPAATADAAGVSVVPLLVRFGDEELRAGVDISAEDFWRRLTAPGAPFPTTAAAPPGDFRDAFERAFAEGAEAVVYVGVSEKLSATIQSARIARELLAEREIRIVDSENASLGVGLLALMAAELAAAGESADEVERRVVARRRDVKLYLVLETLEYLRRGGRISGARAAIGSVLSVKPIITIDEGVVETADRPRTRTRARARLLELLTEHPVERAWIIHGQASGIAEFASELSAAAGLAAERVQTALIGPVVGPHVGPGAYGAFVLRSVAESTGAS